MVVEWETEQLSPLVVVTIPLWALGSIRLGPVNAWDIADMEMLVLPVIVRTSVPATLNIFATAVLPRRRCDAVVLRPCC